MATAQTMLAAVQTAYQAVVDQMADGKLTVEYAIRGRRHRYESPTVALANLRGEISHWQRIVNRAARSPFRLVKLSRARGST